MKETKTTKQVNVYDIIEAFKKIHSGLDEKYLSQVEEQMSIIMPLPESEVVTLPGYNESQNKMSITFFVSKPKDVKTSKEHKFMEIITSLLIKTNTDKLIRLNDCINDLERYGEKYEINGTITDYSDKLGDYTFYLFIYKKEKNEKRI